MTLLLRKGDGVVDLATGRRGVVVSPGPRGDGMICVAFAGMAFTRSIWRPLDCLVMTNCAVCAGTGVVRRINPATGQHNYRPCPRCGR